MKKRILSLLMVLSMIITMLPAGTLTAFAADVPSDVINGDAEANQKTTEPAPVQTTPEIVTIQYVPDVDLPDNDELFAGYAEQMFSPWGGVSFFGMSAGALLSGDEKAVYDALVPIINDIANGERASTHIGLGQTLENVNINGVTTTLTADASVDFTGNDFSDVSLDAVVSALLADFPYEMYWYDKVTGVQMGVIPGTDTLLHVYFEFTVATQYRATDVYTADTAKTGAAKTAAANAAAIVAKYKDSSDYEKLVGYKAEICDLVSYDHTAADDDTYFTTTSSDPWQLIYVFDGDTDTNVVCEGYAKAFQYLCDLTTWNDDSIVCYTVTGQMVGGTGEGPHMWNIVTMEDSKNYLVDVTNSDEESVGAVGGLFLAGGSSASAEFSIDNNTKIILNGYIANVPATDNTLAAEVGFYYDLDTLAMWCEDNEIEGSILELSKTSYDNTAVPTTYTVTVSANPTEGGTIEGGGTVGAGASVTLTATAAAGYTFTGWTEDGTTVSTDATYTFTVSANRDLVANFETTGGSACAHNYVNGFCETCDAYQPATDSNGDGYYAIENAGQLYWFAALVNGGEPSANAVLTADITVNTGVLNADGTLNGDGSDFRAWTPIGSDTTSYTGTFDGNGKTVSGLYFNDSNTSNVGLFGYVGENGEVRNVGVVDSYFCGDYYVGGVVGWNEGTVEGCYNTGAVTGRSIVGGVVGQNEGGTVENCYNTGDVTGSVDYVGGVAGSNVNYGTVEDCYNTGSVSGDYYVGGVLGKNNSGGTVTNCYNTGSVTGSDVVGDVVGPNTGTVTNCYYRANSDDGNGGKTVEQFASGEVAYLLQGGVAAVNGAVPEIWGQNLDNDKTPDAFPNFTGAKVYQITNTGCKTYGEYSYSNVESTVYAPEHTGNFSYTPNEGGTTHKKAYDCCGVVADEAEAHDFTNGKCVCGEKPTPVVTVTAAAGLSYTGAAQELLTGSTTGGTIWYKLDDGTYSTTIPTATDAGTYTVYYKVVGDENYKDVAEQSIEVSIAPKTVTITGATIEDVLFNENGGYALKVTAVTFNGVVEGENLDYTASAVLTGNNAVANGVAATVTVTLSNSNYSLQATTFAGSVNIIEHKHVWNYEANGSIITAICSGDIGVCSVTNKTVTIKLVAPTNLTYDGTAKAVTVEQSPAGVFTDLPVVEYTGDRQNVSVDGFTASITIDGAKAEAKFTIEKAKPTVAWDSTTASVKYTGFMATITAPTVTLVNNESFSGTISYSYTGTSSGSGLPTNAGTYTITANIDAQGNYTAATSTNTLTLTITKAAAPAIVWPTASDLVYGQKLSASTLTSTDSNGTFAWQNGEDIPTVTNSGYVVIYTPNNTANYDYSGVEPTKTISVTVGKAAATATAAPAAKALTYTGEAQALVNAGTTSDGTLVYSLTENGQYTETIPTGTNAGEYTVWYYVVGDANHSNSVKASVKVTIAKAKATITVDTSTITVTYGETVNLPIATSNFGTVSCDTTADKLVNAGTYTVTYSVAAADNWEGDTKTLQVVVEQLAVVEPTVNGTYTYTGEEQTVALTGVESYMTVASGYKGTNADTYEVEITLNSNYKWANGSDGKLQWSIAKAQAEITVDTTPIEKTYGDTWTLPEAATNFGTVSADKTVADMVNAGTYTVTYTVEGTDNYNGAETTITVTVIPKVVTAAVTVVGENFIFNGSEQKPGITVKDGENTIPESEYTVTYKDNTNAGTATVTITDKDGGNYTVSGSTTFEIAKKASAALSGVECEFTRLTATTGNEIDVEAMLPDDHGTATYTITSSGYTVLENVAVDANGKLVFDTKTSETAASDTITVNVEMQNYTDVTLTVSVRLSEKAPQTITGVSAATGLIYNGEAQQGYTGTPTSDFNGAYEITYTGRDNAYNSSTAPTNAGDYTVTFKIPDSDLYYSGNISVNFTIDKAQVTVTANDKEVYVGNRMPELTYKVSGLIGDDTISVELSCDANMNRTGEYPIVVTAADPNGNYEITTVNGTLTVKYYPISSPIITPTYSPVVDGGNNGDVTVSPKNPAKGDTVTITPDPDKGYEVDKVIVTDKNGKPVTVIDNGDGTYSFKQPNGKANIEVTFTEITEADETEKIETIEKSCTLDNTCPMHRYDDLDMTAWYHEGVHFCLENGLMNGTGADTFAPDMTTSRAMIVTILWRLEGEPVVNHAMDFDDVAADTWYTEAIRWAASEGIVNGYSDKAFGPNDAITREQLATILYRYEQYKDGGFNGLWMIRMDYVDLADVSDWAYEAMCWMNMNGIVNGKPGKVLDPKGSATRAESATMLYRYCEVMTKENDN